MNILDTIKLNWGIKRAVRKSAADTHVWIDTAVLFPLMQRIQTYLGTRLIRHYGADYRWNDEASQQVRKKTGWLGYGATYYSLVRNTRPKRILCIGSMYGFIPYVFARACADNKLGHVDFVDAGYDINGGDKATHNFGQGFWKKPKAKHQFAYLGNERYITSHIMTSERFAKEHPNATYDIVYVDGDHSYAGVKKDYDLFWKRIRPRGYMIFHDVEKKGSYKGIAFEMSVFWQELIRKKRAFIQLPNRISGIGILQKI